MGSTPTRSRHGGPISSDADRPARTGRPDRRASRRSSAAAPGRAARRRPARPLTAIARGRRRRRAASGWPAIRRPGPRRRTSSRPRRRARARGLRRPGVEPVINATGVIVHTNLGRAPWPAAAIEAGRGRWPRGYLLLELDRATGRRGARARVAEDHLVALTGAEDALVTNNNAAAVALAVGLAGRGGGVAVSRGELVEIGGGVRIPEIVRRAGARLIEVGTTNRTRAGGLRGGARRWARPRRPARPSLELRQAGFTETPDPAAVAEARPCATARSSSTTWAAARSSTPPRSASPTSRCPASAWRPAPTSSRSAATSSSAGRRPGSSSAARTSSPACAATRWPGRCDRTR